MAIKSVERFYCQIPNLHKLNKTNWKINLYYYLTYIFIYSLIFIRNKKIPLQRNSYTNLSSQSFALCCLNSFTRSRFFKLSFARAHLHSFHFIPGFHCLNLLIIALIFSLSVLADVPSNPSASVEINNSRPGVLCFHEGFINTHRNAVKHRVRGFTCNGCPLRTH